MINETALRFASTAGIIDPSRGSAWANELRYEMMAEKWTTYLYGFPHGKVVRSRLATRIFSDDISGDMVEVERETI